MGVWMYRGKPLPYLSPLSAVVVADSEKSAREKLDRRIRVRHGRGLTANDRMVRLDPEIPAVYEFAD